MLGTTYYLFKNGGSQNVTLSGTHLLVYWVAPILGGCVAAILYVMYKNGGGENVVSERSDEQEP